MEGPRSPKESEYPQILEFLHAQLRPESDWSLHQEYPTVFNPKNLHNIRIITDERKVLSHAVLKPLIVKTPIVIFKVGAIGSVVTDSQYRGHGFSTKILEDCLIEAKRQGCDFAVLWTQLHDFYRRLNFELTGSEISCVVEEEFSNSEIADLKANLKFIKGSNVSAEAIYRLYSQHTVGSVRTIEDIRKFMNIPQSNIYTAWDKNGQLVAYAVEGKGADLANYIHEWGGGVSKIMALLSYIRTEKKQKVTIILPRHATNLHKKLSEIPGLVINEGFLGMIKIVNEMEFFVKIKKAARQNGFQELILERQGTEIIFGIPGDLLSIKDEKDLVTLLFGFFDEIPHVSKDSNDKLKKIFPLPLWFWGWDSV